MRILRYNRADGSSALYNLETFIGAFPNGKGTVKVQFSSNTADLIVSESVDELQSKMTSIEPVIIVHEYKRPQGNNPIPPNPSTDWFTTHEV